MLAIQDHLILNMSYPIDNLMDISFPEELFPQSTFSRSLLDIVSYDLSENELKKLMNWKKIIKSILQ